MSHEPSLETQLRILIEEYRRLKAADVSHRQLLEEQDALIKKLEAENGELRKSIDALNADRFTVKRLRDERKLVRRKVDAALGRIENLEREVAHVFKT